MKKLIAMLLCLVMVLGLAACGSSGGKTGIVGNWKATVNFADIIGAEDLAGMEEYINVDKINLTITLKFTDDGKYTLALDQKSVDNMIDVIADGMEDMFKDMAELYGISYEDLMAESGISDLREALAEEMDLGDIEESGKYTWEDGVLTMDGEETDVELNGNTLTVDIDGVEVTFKRS